MKFILSKFLFFLYLSILFSQNYDPNTGLLSYRGEKYISFLVGFGSGDFSLTAESAFSDPDNPSESLWEAEVLDVAASLSRPQLVLKFGGWKGWKGADMELSYVGQKIANQIVYYDSHGQIFIPPTSEDSDGYYYSVEPQDSVDLEDGFLQFDLFSISGTGYINMHLTQKIRPYFGIGVSFGLNKVSSEYPGPGSYAAKNVMAGFGYNIKNSDKLNTTDYGAGFHIPFGVKYLVDDKIFFNPEFRISQSFLSFSSSDAYLKEKDKGTLQTFHASIGIGIMLK